VVSCKGNHGESKPCSLSSKLNPSLVHEQEARNVIQEYYYQQ